MWLHKLSQALKLDEAFDQDWGICNSDSKRVQEFIAFFKSNIVEHPWETEALAELIFQSMNDAIEENELTEDLVTHFKSFVKSNSKTFPMNMKYWCSLLGNQEFPVAEMIKECS